MLNGLDLFSGYGGLTLALREWVRPIAYCEIEKYCQGVLLSRMDDGTLPWAPIWEDVKTLKGKNLPRVDIIVGGFPCQDLSVAGVGKGLDGERSGLFYEILRLSEEIKPKFLFLENVIGIRKKGLHTVGRELANIGYDCRWGVVSAEQVGAPHQRKRWFLLAYANGTELRKQQRRGCGTQGEGKTFPGKHGPSEQMAHPLRNGSHNTKDRRSFEKEFEYCQKGENNRSFSERRPEIVGEEKPDRHIFGQSWWSVEPNVGRVVNGTPFRVDRIKSLGNGVVPLQAKTAFKKLMGLT